MREEKITGTEKEFLDTFKELCISRSSWQVWADLMAAMACTLANSVDKHYLGILREKKSMQSVLTALEE